MNLYQQKYLKYKTKYELLKKQIGGNPRILKDLNSLKKTPLPGVTVEPLEGNIFILHGTITGPSNSPYAGYMWRIRMNMPERYPFKPPTVNFMDKIFHPNISYTNGAVCVSILKEEPSGGSREGGYWNPALTIGGILLSIQSLLMDPNTSSPLNSEASTLYDRNVMAYNEKVRHDAVTYATLVPPQ